MHDREECLRLDKITDFNESSLAKCRSVLIARKQEKLKYADIILPEHIGTNKGYHLPCYRKFVALSKAQRERLNANHPKNDTPKISRINRSDVKSPKPDDRTGKFPTVCLFCCKDRKKVQGVEQKLCNVQTDNFEANIRKYARWKGDDQLITRIAEVNFHVNEVKYHKHCRKAYQKSAETTQIGIAEMKEVRIGNPVKEKTTFWYLEREVYANAFDALVPVVEENIIEKEEVHLLSNISRLYQALVRGIGGYKFKDAEPTAQKLEIKLLNHFQNKICIEKGSTKRGNIVYSQSMNKEDIFRKQHKGFTSLDIQIRDIAYTLRESIMNAERKPLPENLKLEDISKGEVDVPYLVTLFFQHLIGGPDSRRWRQDSKQRRISSLSQDAVFAATSGMKKPRKHLQLGVALKSLTGSKKVINMLNRMGPLRKLPHG